MYVDYEFYSNNWGGDVEENEFKRLELQARSVIDMYTFGRLKNKKTIPDEVKYAMCELIDYEKQLNDTGGKEIAGEKTASHSITYAVSKQGSNRAIKSKQKDIVRRWLINTDLMYRGVSNAY